MSSTDSRAGIAAILGGALIFAGQAGELAFGSERSFLNALWVVLGAFGFAALMVAIWRLRHLVSGRIGRIGWRISVAGGAFLGLFAVQALVTVAVTGNIPGNFALFAIGFLLLFVGPLVLAPDLRGSLGRGWVLPLVGAAGILVAITLEADPIHDIGLFVFEGAWIALGIAVVRAEGRRQPRTAAVFV